MYNFCLKYGKLNKNVGVICANCAFTELEKYVIMESKHKNKSVADGGWGA